MINNLKNITKCSCGHTIDDPMIVAKTKYSKWGWFLLSMAFSAMPKEVVFQCQQCGDIIDTSTDPDVLEKYRYNSDISK
ncbi:MAG: hypothetical protein EHM58_04305 [Ignavibacteriae bacterium]|nr:MAG: hypothetical protein EHM58_04305 [Ignavibacteriota bacterium]